MIFGECFSPPQAKILGETQKNNKILILQGNHPKTMFILGVSREIRFKFPCFHGSVVGKMFFANLEKNVNQCSLVILPKSSKK